MEKESLKHSKRRKNSRKKFDKRLKFVLSFDIMREYLNKCGIDANWTIKEVRKKFKYLKHTSTLCSCYLCSNGKYSRAKQAKINKQLENIE